MELSHQVCSLDLAKRLKELGVKQDSYFYWYEMMPYLLPSGHGGKKDVIVHGRVSDDDAGISAFTVSEMGEMLPENFWHDGKRYFIEMLTEINEEGVRYWQLNCYHAHDDVIREKYVKAKTEADARAKMLVYLIENNLL